PERSVSRLIFASLRVRRLPPSRKVSTVKSTWAMRLRVLVVDPHSMSTVPLLTALMRSSGVTLTNFTASWPRLRSFLIASATRRQRSMEYPCGLGSLVVTKEKGGEDWRWPMVKAPVRLIRARVSSCCAAAGTAELRSSAPSRAAGIEGSSRRMAVSLLGQAVHEVHVYDQGAGRGHGSEVLLEDRRHLARSVHPRETAVDGEAEGGVAPPENEAVRLVREVFVDEGELL